MNRAERRAKPKKSRVSHLKMPPVIRPLLHEVHMVFGPIDTFLEQLRANSVLCSTSLEPIFVDQEGGLYKATPNVRVFVSALERIMRHYQIAIDYQPLVKLCNKLDAFMPITPESVEVCQGLMLESRNHYRKMDLRVVKGIVNTELINVELQDLGVKK